MKHYWIKCSYIAASTCIYCFLFHVNRSKIICTLTSEWCWEGYCCEIHAQVYSNPVLPRNSIHNCCQCFFISNLLFQIDYNRFKRVIRTIRASVDKAKSKEIDIMWCCASFRCFMIYFPLNWNIRPKWTYYVSQQLFSAIF